MGKRYAVVLEVELTDEGSKKDVERWTEHLTCRTPAISRVTVADPIVRVERLADRPKGGLEVVFIYNPGHHQEPCHAVVKQAAIEKHVHFPDKDSPWSKERHGFCGVEPDYGPMSWCKEPDGGLCRECAKYVHKVGGKWVTRDNMPAPKPRQKHVPEPCGGCYDDD